MRFRPWPRSKFNRGKEYWVDTTVMPIEVVSEDCRYKGKVRVLFLDMSKDPDEHRRTSVWYYSWWEVRPLDAYGDVQIGECLNIPEDCIHEISPANQPA